MFLEDCEAPLPFKYVQHHESSTWRDLNSDSGVHGTAESWNMLLFNAKIKLINMNVLHLLWFNGHVPQGTSGTTPPPPQKK